MDIVYWNILKLGNIVEETSLSTRCDTTLHNIPSNPQKSNLLPPPGIRSVDIVGNSKGKKYRHEKIYEITYRNFKDRRML